MKNLAKIITSAALLLSSAAPVFAQDAAFSFPTDRVPFTNLGDLLANALLILFFFAAVLAFVFIVIGGIQWITAGGDKVAAQAARDRITAAVVGLLIVVAAFAITLIITTVLGVNIFEGTYNFPSPGNIFKPNP
jgi:uncharacterized membrane protein (UPF0182 family)